MMPKLSILCLVFLVDQWRSSLVRASALLPARMELCGPETELELTKTGESSSMMVTLMPVVGSRICKLRVTAPKTHVVNVQLIETKAEEGEDEENETRIDNNLERRTPCVMSIFLPDNPRTPVWKGDVCGRNPMTDIDLLTPDFKIIWNSPENASNFKAKQFVITAVGKGSVCKDPSQHTCMRIGWDPMLCVADHLLCDGIQNCPKTASSSDEDADMCRSHLLAQTSWEQLAVEIFKKLKPPTDLVNSNKWLYEKLGQHAASLGTSAKKSTSLEWREWQETKENETATTQRTTTHKPRKSTDSISQVLSKYGPWGYLMLGMLMCGTVLMFCGLWECCFKKPKDTTDDPSRTGQNQPTTVLIINTQEGDNSPQQPPNYDDLDRPPSYATLFPNLANLFPKTNSTGQEAGSPRLQNNNDVDTHSGIDNVALEIGEDIIIESSSARTNRYETNESSVNNIRTEDPTDET